MAITRIGSASAEAATVTIPTGHAPGDLIIIYTFRTGSTTAPTVPSGFTSHATGSGTSCSMALGYRVATSASETSGTWTNATEIVCVVYRGQLSSGTPLGTATGASGSNLFLNFAATTTSRLGASWWLGFAGYSTTDTNMEQNPSGMFLVVNQVGASAEAAAWDTNGRAKADWPGQATSLAGTSGNWLCHVAELKAQGTLVLPNKVRPRIFSPGIAR